MKKSSYWRHVAVPALLFGAAAVQAHDAWIEPAATGFAVVFGHDGKLETALPSKVLKAQAIDAAGRSLPLRLDGLQLAVQGTPSLLLLHYDNGFWSRTPAGTKSGARNAVPGALGASHALKYGKTVQVWDAQASRAQGLPVEIVPLSAQAPAAGTQLPVQVLWDGQPLAGATLSWHDAGQDRDIRADAQGRATLPVAKGRQLFSVSARRPIANDARADTLSVSSALVFEAR
ncbi:DUF4198 domain-containing protein [Pseudorhodoferax sp.]|uniref:DUF4198 domain-containing protein n=1 Tax=Pseudorhodoferax sp. TaxID=1993553 RepID=UPI002DD6A1F4|nr:DUF4198 domain-containing protein [Pseudorhodoferax sp.]